MNSALNALAAQLARYLFEFWADRASRWSAKPPSTQTQADNASAAPAPAPLPPTKASQEAPYSDETPFQRMIRASGMLPPMTEERLRQIRADLERIKVERPDFYQALLESKERLTKVAEAMYPSPEEYERLLALKNPKDY
jgi:hypothetical protein